MDSDRKSSQLTSRSVSHLPRTDRAQAEVKQENVSVESAERIRDGIAVTFADGTTVQYGIDFLWKHRNEEGNRVVGKDSKPPGSSKIETETLLKTVEVNTPGRTSPAPQSPDMNTDPDVGGGSVSSF